METRVESKQISSNYDAKRNGNPCWKKATECERKSYNDDLNTRLKNFTITVCLLNCSDVHCENVSHKIEIDDLMIALLDSMELAADAHIPQLNTYSGKKNWNSELNCYKDKAQFWRSVWLSAGRPQNGQLNILMRRTRNIYHLQIRKMKRIQHRIKRNTLLNACLNNNGDLFKEIKKQRKCKKTIATSIDGHQDNIPIYFAKKYKNLYNSVDDKTNLARIAENLESKINKDSLNDLKVITPELIKAASQKLKPGKSDPLLKVTSEFFLNAPDPLYDLLSLILKSFITHDHVGDFLVLSSLIPIVKDKLAATSNSNNYRSIAIISLVMKIFDWVIILAYNKYLQFDDLQFGYQPNVSTSMCTWTAVETISYFTRNGSDVFTCLMDMRKAFDTVQHSVLFNKLLEQDFPHIVVRYLLTTYRLQRANVKWNNEASNFFEIGNGVKQGAVLSAVFYCIYTNGLFKELRRLNIGCCIGQNYVGIIGYADDLFLICPTLDGLQKMLNVCELYASRHNLCFSTDPDPNKSKTKCIAFLQKKRNIRNLNLCGNPLPWVNSGKHLGTKIENPFRSILSQDMKDKRAQYIHRNNELMQEFAYADSVTKTKINSIYNSHFHGSVLWDLFGLDAARIYKTWNTSIRKMFRLDRTTHRYFIEPVSNVPHIKISFIKRFIKFSEKLSCSTKICARNIFHSTKHDCRSNIGRNLRAIMKYCDKPRICDITTIELTKLSYQPVPIDKSWEIQLVKELIDVRDNILDLDDWRKEEVVDCIHSLTTS